MPPTATQVLCADGYRLQGHWHRPSTATGLTVVLAPAMLVREGFYGRLASWLADQGVHTLTFDYRGAGTSLAAETERWSHRLEHWGQRDLSAVIGAARRARPDDRVALIGHSMGGQIIGLTPALHDLEAVVTVAATAAWWGHWPRPERWGIRAWYHVLPVLGRALPIFPAGRFGLGPDTASTLVRGWAKWGRHPDYLYGPFGLRHHTADYTGRVLAYRFSDDISFGCARAVEALHRPFGQADLRIEALDPADHGLESLGHFGWFRARSLWPAMLTWLRRGS